MRRIRIDALARLFIVLAVVIALAGAAILGYWFGDRPEGTTPVDRVVGVTRAVNVGGTAIAIDGAPDRYASGAFDVGAALGRECLIPLSVGQRVELGIVRTRADRDQPGTDVVAWVNCLSLPTVRDPR